MGVDVAYAKITSAATPTGFIGANTASANTTFGAGTGVVSNTDNWTARFRVHKDFYP
jgi:hypothetical protein